MKKQRMIQFIFLFVIITISLFPNFSLAGGGGITEGLGGSSRVESTEGLDPIENPGSFQPGSLPEEDINKITDRANSIIGVIVTVGVVISVVTLAILGIKYMIGSVEERAEYKKSMLPYLIGSILLFAASTVVGIIGTIVQNINFS